MKRIFDVFFAATLLIILCVPMLIIAFLIVIDLGFPILFVQTRPGLKGKPFSLYKFRTMIDIKDKEKNILSDEFRLTTLGKVLRKFSFDEFPQLLNVIKGDISFVGPRPLLMEYLCRYTPEQARRHEIKPGITGWAQVNGRNAITWEEKFKLDLWYVDNRSFLLDIKIIWLTLIKVLKQEGICAEGHETMPKFLGSHEKK